MVKETVDFQKKKKKRLYALMDRSDTEKYCKSAMETSFSHLRNSGLDGCGHDTEDAVITRKKTITVVLSGKQ